MLINQCQKSKVKKQLLWQVIIITIKEIPGGAAAEHVTEAPLTIHVPVPQGQGGILPAEAPAGTVL